MNVRKYSFAIIIALATLYACNNDDDNAATVTPPRDRAEQQVTDDQELQSYLKTHFYTLENVDLNGDDIPEYQIAKFDTITNGQTPIIDSPLFTSKKVTLADVEYELYILKLGEGVGNQPTFSDSTVVTYRGKLLYTDNDDLFDSAITPVTFDQVSVVNGWREALTEIKSGSGLTVGDDGGLMPTNDDYGQLVVFMPSGLGYFNVARVGIPSYSPLIFNIQLYVVNEADHDRDGIPSYLEDLDGDRQVLDSDDDTDADNVANYLDNDDDGDGTLTRDEITVNDLNKDGFITENEITFYNDDGDDLPNHLDPDDRDLKNE